MSWRRKALPLRGSEPQRRHVARAWSVLALAVAIVAGDVVAAEAANREATEQRLRAQLKPYFPNVSLRSHDGKAVRFYDDLVKGKVVLIQLLSTDCSKFCSTITANLARAEEALHQRPGTAADRVVLLSLTVNPELDRPQILRAYARQFNVDRRNGWYFLTGSKADIDTIRRRLGVYDPDEARTEHLAVLTIGNESTGQWLAMPALSPPQEIVRTTLRLMGSR